MTITTIKENILTILESDGCSYSAKTIAKALRLPRFIVASILNHMAYHSEIIRNRADIDNKRIYTYLAY